MTIEKCDKCSRGWRDIGARSNASSAFVILPDGTAVCPTCAETIVRAAIRLRIAAAADLENADKETRAEMQVAIAEFRRTIPPPKSGGVQN